MQFSHKRPHLSLTSLTGCLYKGEERANGETWDDASDPCAVCVCLEGSVQCERKHCPPSNCKHPVQRQCCMSCDGGWKKATFQKIKMIHRPLCQHFAHWTIIPTLSNFLLTGCMFHGKEYLDGTEFGDDKDPCGVCYCYGGEVVCTKIPCYGDCSHPYKPPGQCCGECDRMLSQTLPTVVAHHHWFETLFCSSVPWLQKQLNELLFIW